MSHTSGRAYFHLHEPCVSPGASRSVSPGTPKLGVVPERPVVSQIMSISFPGLSIIYPNRHVYDERSNGPLVQKKPERP